MEKDSSLRARWRASLGSLAGKAKSEYARETVCCGWRRLFVDEAFPPLVAKHDLKAIRQLALDAKAHFCQNELEKALAAQSEALSFFFTENPADETRWKALREAAAASDAVDCDPPCQPCDDAQVAPLDAETRRVEAQRRSAEALQTAALPPRKYRTFSPAELHRFAAPSLASYAPQTVLDDCAFDAGTVPLGDVASCGDQYVDQQFQTLARAHWRCRHFHKVVFSRLLSSRAALLNALELFHHAQADADLAARWTPELPFAYVAWGDALLGLERFASAATLFAFAATKTTCRAPLFERVSVCRVLEQDARMNMTISTAIPGRDYCFKTLLNPVKNLLYDWAGKLRNVVHFVTHAPTRQTLVVDPCWDVTGLVEFAKRRRLQIVGVLITHGHVDHVGGTPPPPFDALRIRVPGVVTLMRRLGPSLRVFIPALEVLRIMEMNPDMPEAQIVPVRDGDTITLPFSDTALPLAAANVKSGLARARLRSLQDLYSTDGTAALVTAAAAPDDELDGDPNDAPDQDTRDAAVAAQLAPCLLCHLERRVSGPAAEQSCPHSGCSPLMRGARASVQPVDPSLDSQDDARVGKEAAELLGVLRSRRDSEAPVESVLAVDSESDSRSTLSISVLHTPGHTPGSSCFLVNNCRLLTGDTLFCNTMGRVDLCGSDRRAMWRSLQRLRELDDSTIVLPGHDYGGLFTTIGRERTNGVLRYTDEASWSAHVESQS